MARKKEIAQRKQELISQLAESRTVIDHGRSAIKEKLSVKKQVTSLVKRKPKAVFAGSAVAGLAATLLLRRPRKSKKKDKKPIKSLIIGWIMLLLKPAAKKWVKKSLQTYAIGKLSSFTQRPRPRLSNEVVDADVEAS